MSRPIWINVGVAEWEGIRSGFNAGIECMFKGALVEDVDEDYPQIQVLAEDVSEMLFDFDVYADRERDDGYGCVTYTTTTTLHCRSGEWKGHRIVNSLDVLEDLFRDGVYDYDDYV